MGEGEYVTMTEAARLLGVGRMTLWRRVQEGVLPVYQSGRDRRVRLIKRADIEALLAPKPIKLENSQTSLESDQGGA